MMSNPRHATNVGDTVVPNSSHAYLIAYGIMNPQSLTPANFYSNTMDWNVHGSASLRAPITNSPHKNERILRSDSIDSDQSLSLQMMECDDSPLSPPLSPINVSVSNNTSLMDQLVCTPVEPSPVSKRRKIDLATDGSINARLPFLSPHE
jgi:hypothetical protein